MNTYIIVPSVYNRSGLNWDCAIVNLLTSKSCAILHKKQAIVMINIATFAFRTNMFTRNFSQYNILYSAYTEIKLLVKISKHTHA